MEPTEPQTLASRLAGALAPIGEATAGIRCDGPAGVLPSLFDVTGLASASIGVACAELAALGAGDARQPVVVDPLQASRWFAMTLSPIGWQLPPIWDAIAGLYGCRDRWIRLHTNAAAHRAAALRVLRCAADRDAVSVAAAAWEAEALEEAVVSAGGCAAALRSADEWRAHPQGVAVAAEPLIAWGHRDAPSPARWHAGSGSAPLAGLRVLDCTRVLAGPVCTRLLAGFGAEVLRIDPPGWGEPNVEPEVNLGKHLATLDLRRADGLQTFHELLADADVLVHGYRPGALDALGLDAAARDAINPALIDVALCAYGWSGPWAQRRGYDSLVQMSTGIAHEGMRHGDGINPQPLPVQALDHATGYLMAAAVLRSLRIRRESGRVCSARLSLARTASTLMATSGDPQAAPLPAADDDAFGEDIEPTDWGPARRLRFPVLTGCPLPVWPLPARRLHSDPAAWTV